MADIAALSLSVDSSQVKQAVATLNTLPPAASAAERAAAKWGTTTDAAARSADDFSKRVTTVISSLQFQQAQLARTSDEQERYTALKRAGVAAMSAEGQAISAAVKSLQTQRQALNDNATVAQKVKSGFDSFKATLEAIGVMKVADKLFEMAKGAFEAAAGMQELADQLGITARGLQGLQYQAVQNGVSLEQLENGVSKFSQKIGEAAGGNKEMIDSLNTLGVKVKDANGNLRPTEALLQDVAKAIIAIPDPAKQSAAAVDFFGKAGMRMLPLLGEMAKGIDTLANSAERQGAMMSDATIESLDKIADRFARSKLEHQAFFANTIAMVVEWADDFQKKFLTTDPAVAKARGQALVTGIQDAFDSVADGLIDLNNKGGRFVAGFLALFANIPSQLGKLFVDGMNNALDALTAGLSKISAEFANSWLGRQIGADGSAVNLGHIGGGGASLNDLGAAVKAAQEQATANQQFSPTTNADARAAARANQAQIDMQASEAVARQGKMSPTVPGGASNPTPKASGGETPEQKYAALEKQLENTKAAQDAMTAAAAKGDQAFEAQKASVEAQNKVLEIYKTQLSDTDPRLTKIRDLMISIAQGKVAEAFSVATTELEKQNVVLEAQIRLMNETPEIQAREIALIKAKQEAEKGGAAITQEALDARTQAIEQNEKLKAQQADLQKAQELWTAPLKQALQDIQTSAADAFEQILTSGNFSFQSLADTFKKIITKMIAEFLALATVRPIMSVVVDAIGSPALAKDLGLSSSLSGGSSTLAGSGGGGGLFGSMGGGGLFGGGGISDFLNQNLIGGSENLGPLQPGAASLGSSGGLTIGGALGGVAGLGAGAFQLLTGKGSTGSLLGGGASILGGGLSLLGPALGIGAAAGPIGIGIGLLGSVLGGLLGGSTPPTITNSAQGNLMFGGNGFNTNGVSTGPDASSTPLEGQLKGLASGITSIFDALGGVKDPSKVFGLSLQSFSQQYPDGSNFSNQTSSIVGPDGSRRQWGQGSTDADVGLAGASAEVAIESILNGAVGKITDNMRKALNDLDNAGGPASLEQIQKTITDITAFDDAVGKFGHTTTDAENQIQQIDASFQGLYDTAKQYNLAASETLKIDQEKTRQELEATKGFSDNIAQQITAMTDPFKASMDAIGLAEAKDLATNSTYLKMVQGYADQSLSIEQLYQLQRQKVIDDSNAQALAAQQQAAAAQLQVSTDLVNGITASVNSIEDLIKQLSPGGDLGNVDPSSQLAGLRASYNASFAQAMADPTNQALIAKEVADAQAFAQTSLKFNAGGSAYVADQRMLLDQQQSLQGADVLSGVQSASDPAVKNLLQQLLGVVSGSTNDNSQRDADMATVISLLTRYLANGRTAA